MQYEILELIPLVKELTEKFTGKASTSVTYETAQQLMGAVLYCLDQAGEDGFSAEQESPREKGEAREGEFTDQKGRALIRPEQLASEEAYKRGAQVVFEKTRWAQELYGNIMASFDGYGQISYEETLHKTIPAFFTWYDVRFYPQQEVFLSYPVPLAWEEKRGIHQVLEYLTCIEAEQQFFKSLPPAYVQEVLWAQEGDYRDQVINLGGILVKHILVHLLLEMPFNQISCSLQDRGQLAEQVRSMGQEQLRNRLEQLANIFVDKQGGGQDRLRGYLRLHIPDLAAELMLGAENGCMEQVL